MRAFYITINDTMTISALGYSDHLKVILGKQSNHTYIIPIDKQPCHYGGFRSYFRCPLCDNRSRMLYFDEKSLLLCRKCLNLSYKSQQLRAALRYDYMIKKIINAVKGKGGDVALHEKPPKMHYATYYNIRSKIIDYETKAEQARLDGMVQLFGEERVAKFFDSC